MRNETHDSSRGDLLEGETHHRNLRPRVVFRQLYAACLIGVASLALGACARADEGATAPPAQLPSPPATDAPTASDTAPATTPSAGDTELDKYATGEEYESAENVVRRAFSPPPGGRSLNRNASLWIDPKTKRVYADGYVVMTRGPIEMFACPMGTKEHEAIVATLAKASQVHAALLAIGAMPGTPVRYLPEFLPATGQRIRVWVTWLDKDGKFHVADGRSWIQKSGTEESMKTDWVFAGSGFWTDEADGREYYKADSGDMICVSNFNTAMMDLPIESSAQADELLYVPYTERIPSRGMPVRLILVPIPVPSDEPAPADQLDPNQPPGQDVLSKGPSPAKIYSEPTPDPAPATDNAPATDDAPAAPADSDK